MNIMQLMELSIFDDSNILSGHNGANNNISNATFIDAPDGYKWCKKGDFVITTGYPFIQHRDENNGILQLIKRLSEKQCSGIGIKLGRYLPNISKDVIAFSNKNKLPIISLPNQLTWAEIIHPITSQLNQKQQNELKETHFVYEKFHEHLKKQESLSHLVQLLRSMQKVPVTIFTRIFNEVISTDNINISNEEIDLLISKVKKETKEGLQTIKWKNIDLTVKWIFNNNIVQGGVFLWGMSSELTAPERASIEQASTIIALKIEQRKSISNASQRYKNEFISDMLENVNIKYEALVRRAKEMDWELEHKYKVLLLRFSFKGSFNEDSLQKWKQNEFILESIQNRLVPLFSDILSGLDRKNNVVLLLTQDISVKHLIHEFKKITPKEGVLKTFVGAGRLYPLSKLNTSYKEAIASLNIAYKQSENFKITENNFFLNEFSNINMENIIFSENPLDEIKSLISEYLQKVVDYDNKRDSDLIKTLNSYLNNNGNVEATADELIVHKNTIRYRIELVEKITTLNIRKLNNKLLLKVMVIGLIYGI